MEFIGSSSAFVAADDIKPFIRADIISQCLSDTDTPISGDPFASNFFAAQLLAACGELESNCIRGGRYGVADLVALVGTSKGLMCMILAGLIKDYCRTRGATLGTQDQASAITSRHYLKQLREGQVVFPFKEVTQAAVMDSRSETPAAKCQRQVISRRNNRYFI